MLYRILFEPKMGATPWAVEQPNGERLYFERVAVLVPAGTETVDGPQRPHGYLVAEGKLVVIGGHASIVREQDAKEA